MDTHSMKEQKEQDSTGANGSTEELASGPKPKAKKTPPKPASRKLRKLIRKSEENATLEPFQVELLKLQRHLEVNDRKMIVIFEGRDAAGKGGTIRRVTRYMNEKHYRVVALGKPTEEQRTQWYLQKYVASFHEAARWFCSIAVGTTGRWWSPSLVSVPRRSIRISCAG